MEALRQARIRMAEGVRARQEAAFALLVRGKSDEQIDRRVSSGPMLRAIFKGMQRAFQPDRAGGFRGDIQYELRGRRGLRRWVIRIDNGVAIAGAGRSPHPSVVIRTSVPTFARMVARELPPAKAWFEGKIQIDGDFQLAARLGEMFGQSSPW